MRIAVSGRADLPKRVELAGQIVAAWEKITGETPVLADGFSRALGRGPGTPLEKLDVDVIVTVGGDGTLLYTLMHNEATVLGVNDGELGFLTEVPPDEIEAALERLHAGDYFVEGRDKLVVHLNGTYLGACCNEVVLKTPRPSKILRFKVHAGKHEIEDVRADGLIVATPTGSTSYALSAGGPLVHPAIEALLLVPLAPFRVSLRPIVLPADTPLKITLAEAEKEAALALDGQVEHTLHPGDELIVQRAEEGARFVRFKPHFYSRMRELFG